MRVLVIGDHCEDLFVIGRAERLSPEAPCPVLNPIRTDFNEGMAGNVAANVKSLESEANLRVIYQSNHIIKTRYVDETSGYILLRVDENDKCTAPLSYNEFVRQYEEFHPAIERFDIVLISDYNKGFLTEAVVQKIVEYVQAKGSLVFLDTKKLLGPWSQNIDFVKINEKEYRQQCEHGEPLRFCRRMIVTLGAAGSKDTGTNILVASEKVEVMDVSGAGDTYFAAFATHYFKNKDLVAAMTYANKAAAVAVSKRGVVAVKQSEIK